MISPLTRRQFLAGTAAAALANGIVADAAHPAPDDELALVRGYADAMLEHARDKYGKQSTPLFVATLDLKSLAMPPAGNRPAAEAYSLFRTTDNFITAANPQWEVDFYQVLYALSQLTGEAKYARAADEALTWFLTHCQSPATGLLAWGEHVGWDVIEDRLSHSYWKGSPQDIHEFSRPWILWDRCLKLAPESCRKFARGLWEHQIRDQKTGRFSRHAHYWKHGPSSGYEFPRHGGFFIATWAAVYAPTGDAELLKAIATLVTAFEGWRDPKTGILSSATAHPKLCWPQSNLSLAIDLWESAVRVPAKLGKRMRDLALQIDGTLLKMPHELEAKGRGFAQSVNVETNVVEVLHEGAAKGGVFPGGRYWPYTVLWATGYGGAGISDAKTALLCLQRHRQSPNADYHRLFLQTADRYLTSEPVLGQTTDPETGKARFVHLTPEMLASPIALLVEAYRLTRQDKYLHRAEHFARFGREKLLSGPVPLPRASHAPQLNCYVACSQADSLMMQYLDLWLAKNRPESKVSLQFTDR